MNNMFDLHGKTALVTGSGRGLGFSYAKGLANAGARVILNGQNEDTLSAAVAQLKSEGFQVLGKRFDVSSEAQVSKVFEEFDRDGIHVDIVINNAGIQYRKPMVDLELESWKKVIDVNLNSVFIVSRQAAKRMIEKGTGGKIINIGSLTSEAARATVSPYTAAKGGVKMLTKAMAAEWAQYNIQANAIGPGYILTDMNAALIENKDFDDWVKASNPTQRWGHPDELIGTAVYLSSSASNYINGQIIYVDGGWLSVL
ncbi:SDR family oxidoreductase [Vibrio gazogenes]|uniref:Gluconate 5-dehydrogenase n=1 Tax=Vibrio gazogenes TaxID=687 RepID=A0A1Z2SAW0_VIBGA|nr:SDR family oxidoreductase [Vibrio gazogenes]ASA54316.1 gluconate 5-dehydrogenase [Vibrio gazogenes]